MVALLISGSILTWAGFNDPQEINGTLSADATPAEAISPVADQDWPAYGRNQEGQRFSPLKQINADNVHNLKEAWVFRTGDVKQPNDPGEITNEVTPIKSGRHPLPVYRSPAPVCARCRQRQREMALRS
ncbi:glucose dehydrogenase [Escherichia coli]|uniref:Glucose dehydrogenase n=1 Tax=Escherichia coli TaxID=562 RepID=A0A376YE29_ECOLX|nr:glucose dehydrogenase [Escherichia coli]